MPLEESIIIRPRWSSGVISRDRYAVDEDLEQRVQLLDERKKKKKNSMSRGSSFNKYISE